LRFSILLYVYWTHVLVFFFFSSRRRHTRSKRDWSSDVCSSDLLIGFQASIACSFNDKFLSGTTKSKSTSNFVPNPSQVGQAPNGLLNENSLGSNSSIENPQIGQA